MTNSFKIVLVEPEIPQNTGSIGRLCLATASELHLIEPMGFEITNTRLKRAGLDYWQHLNVTLHPDWKTFYNAQKHFPCVFFTKYAKKSIFEHHFLPGTFLFFGKETHGLPPGLIAQAKELNPDTLLSIPMYDVRARSLNVANAASIAVYEAIRQNPSNTGVKNIF